MSYPGDPGGGTGPAFGPTHRVVDRAGRLTFVHCAGPERGCAQCRPAAVPGAAPARLRHVMLGLLGLVSECAHCFRRPHQA